MFLITHILYGFKKIMNIQFFVIIYLINLVNGNIEMCLLYISFKYSVVFDISKQLT